MKKSIYAIELLLLAIVLLQFSSIKKAVSDFASKFSTDFAAQMNSPDGVRSRQDFADAVTHLKSSLGVAQPTPAPINMDAANAYMRGWTVATPAPLKGGQR
jgi:hypothetical protein